jgi:hypothetical protein
VSHPSKVKGTRFEVAVADFLRALHPRVERRVMRGIKDAGDLAGIDGWALELKNCARLELGPWMDEAEREALAAGVSRFAVVIKRRRKPVADAFALVPLWLLSELMLPDEAVAAHNANRAAVLARAQGGDGG